MQTQVIPVIAFVVKMDLSVGEEKVYLSEETVAAYSYLTELREQFGPEQEISHITFQDLLLLKDCVTVGVPLIYLQQEHTLNLFEFMGVNPNCVIGLKNALKDVYDDVVYIVSEHTSLIPSLSINLENEELQELKRLFPEKYAVIEFILRYKTSFAVFEETTKVYALCSQPWSIKFRKLGLSFKSIESHGSDSEESE